MAKLKTRGASDDVLVDAWCRQQEDPKEAHRLRIQRKMNQLLGVSEQKETVRLRKNGKPDYKDAHQGLYGGEAFVDLLDLNAEYRRRLLPHCGRLTIDCDPEPDVTAIEVYRNEVVVHKTDIAWR